LSAAEPSSKRAGLVARAAGMLFRPHATWEAVAGESTTAAELYTGYIAPLAAIAPVCGAIGLLVWGASIAGVGIQLKTSVVETLVGAAIDYALSLLAVYLLALFVSLVAPLFGGVASRLQALKLVGYSGTALWVAGVFALYPSLGFPVSILAGLYSLYVLSLGLGPVMQVPHARSLTYFATVLVAAVLLSLVLRLATGFVR
jgi:hypothetical protein